MTNRFAPITDDELRRLRYVGPGGGTTNRIAHAWEREEHVVALCTTRSLVPVLVFRRGVWNHTGEPISLIRDVLSVDVHDGVRWRRLPRITPTPRANSTVDVLSLVTLRALDPGLIGKLFNPHDIRRLLFQYDAKRAQRAKAKPKARK